MAKSSETTPPPDSFRLRYTVAEAMQDAADWTSHMTLHADSRGWRVACLLLREEVLRLGNTVRPLETYVQHWRGRAERAESDCAALRDQLDDTTERLIAARASYEAVWADRAALTADRDRLHALLSLTESAIMDDSAAITFQSFGQYRDWLLRVMRGKSHNNEAQRTAPQDGGVK